MNAKPLGFAAAILPLLSNDAMASDVAGIGQIPVLVIDLDGNHIAPPPKIGTKLHTDFIREMGKQGEHKFLIILDIDRVLSSDDLAMVHTTDTGEVASGELPSKEISLPPSSHMPNEGVELMESVGEVS